MMYATITIILALLTTAAFLYGLYKDAVNGSD